MVSRAHGGGGSRWCCLPPPPRFPQSKGTRERRRRRRRKKKKKRKPHERFSVVRFTRRSRSRAGNEGGLDAGTHGRPALCLCLCLCFPARRDHVISACCVCTYVCVSVHAKVCTHIHRTMCPHCTTRHSKDGRALTLALLHGLVVDSSSAWGVPEYAPRCSVPAHRMGKCCALEAKPHRGGASHQSVDDLAASITQTCLADLTRFKALIRDGQTKAAGRHVTWTPKLGRG